jgi:hypothetical protein
VGSAIVAGIILIALVRIEAALLRGAGRLPQIHFVAGTTVAASRRIINAVANVAGVGWVCGAIQVVCATDTGSLDGVATLGASCANGNTLDRLASFRCTVGHSLAAKGIHFERISTAAVVTGADVAGVVWLGTLRVVGAASAAWSLAGVATSHWCVAVGIGTAWQATARVL